MALVCLSELWLSHVAHTISRKFVWLSLEFLQKDDGQLFDSCVVSTIDHILLLLQNPGKSRISLQRVHHILACWKRCVTGVEVEVSKAGAITR